MKKTLLFTLTVIALSGCSTGGIQREIWTNFSQVGPSAQVPQNRASAIFFRLNNAVEAGAVNVYANKEYLASLLPGGFQQTTLCPLNQNIHAEISQNDPGYIRKHTVGTLYNLKPNAINYFAVISTQKGVTLQPVPAAQGAQIVSQLLRQNHTLPRVNTQVSCNAPSATPAAPKRLKQYNLEASALFKFDKADYANMLPKGKAKIKAVAKDMQKYLSHVSRIEVIGHTDPDGSNAYNQKLSQRRAQTVKKALVANRVKGSLIKPKGLGESQLLIKDCAKRHPKDAKARVQCNQPNRRVEINLYGTPRQIAQ